MSRTLLTQDNISVNGEILSTYGLCETGNPIPPEKKHSIKLTFTLLVNGKLKVWGTHYELEEGNTKGYWKLKNYFGWNDIKDFLCTLGYDLSEINIQNWIDQFEIR